MTAQPNSLEARDIRYHLHSYTDAVRLEAEGPLVIERGDGIYVEAFPNRAWRTPLRDR